MVFPFTETRPMPTSSSASRLDQTPLCALYLFTRIFPVCAGADSSVGGFFPAYCDYLSCDLLKKPFSSWPDLSGLSPNPFLSLLLSRKERPSPSSLFRNGESDFLKSPFSPSPSPKDFFRLSENELPESLLGLKERL